MADDNSVKKKPNGIAGLLALLLVLSTESYSTIVFREFSDLTRVFPGQVCQSFKHIYDPNRVNDPTNVKEPIVCRISIWPSISSRGVTDLSSNKYVAWQLFPLNKVKEVCFDVPDLAGQKILGAGRTKIMCSPKSQSKKFFGNVKGRGGDELF